MVACVMQGFVPEKLNECCAAQTENHTQAKAPLEVAPDNHHAECNGVVDDDDREEGEIVDDFEVIISSEDEEFKLRARIQQLEDKNNDLEKISALAASLTNQYSSFQRNVSAHSPRSYLNFQPISEFSDVSTDDECEQKYHHRRKHKRTNGKRNSDFRRNPFSRREQQHNRRKRRYDHHYSNHHNHQHSEPVVLDSLDSLTDNDSGDYDMNAEEDDMERLGLSRDKLRFALARNGECDIRPKHSLMERLQGRLCRSSTSQSNTDAGPRQENKRVLQSSPQEFDCLSDGSENTADPVDERSTQSPAELKLRLIALKSVILKKHHARKKRDAERAYSPTDMINRVHPTISTDCDIDDLMEISPAVSPERVISPQDFEESQLSVNTKPVDMDLAETDSDNFVDQRDQWPANWLPPAPVPEAVPKSNSNWQVFPPNSLPSVSIPIVIDDDDDDDEIPPPAPSYHIPQVIVEDDDARDALDLPANEYSNYSATDIQSISMDNSQNSHKSHSPNAKSEPSEDEAEALRAMLLAKLKTPELKTDVLANIEQVNEINQKLQTKTSDEDDPEHLRSLLLSSIASKKKTEDQSPAILKQAVRRFRINGIIHGSPEASIKQDELPETIHTQLPEYETSQEQTKTLESHSQDGSSSKDSVSKVTTNSCQATNSAESVNELAYTNEACANVPLIPNVPLVQEVIRQGAIPTPISENISISIQNTAITQRTVYKNLLQQPSPISPIVKIVKPNKVINKNPTLKRKITMLEGAASSIKRPTSLLIKEGIAPLHAASQANSSTRFITSVDPASIKVNKLVITLAESSTEDDEFDMHLSVHNTKSSLDYLNYSDNASPLSLAMDSASGSTTRSNTPNPELVDAAQTPLNLRRTVMNDFFEKKLDDFLKQARSNATTIPVVPEVTSMNVTVSGLSDKPEGVVQKPATSAIKQSTTQASVAVRHLPVASQKEYLRLIERMKVLENKKKNGINLSPKLNADAGEKGVPIAALLNASPTANLINDSNPATTAAETHQAATKSEASIVTKTTILKKTTVVNKVVRKTAIINNIKKPIPMVAASTNKQNLLNGINSANVTKPKETKTAPDDAPTTSKVACKPLDEAAKKSRLIAFENSYLKIGGSLITNLDKSLQMVKEAKRSKIARMRSSQRLKELYAEIHNIKQSVKEEELKIARLQPEIQTTHEIITSLKQKRSKLYRAAMDLGKDLKGADYRLVNTSKTDITLKSAQLTKEIQQYNALLKYKDLVALPEALDTEASDKVKTVEETAMPSEQSSIVEATSVDQTANAVEAPCSTTAQHIGELATSLSDCDKKAIEIAKASCSTEAQEDAILDKLNVETNQSKDVAATSADKQRPHIVCFMKELNEEPCSQDPLCEYRTPICRNYNSQVDVNGMMCPFELMGRCEDMDCSFMHLTRIPMQPAS